MKKTIYKYYVPIGISVISLPSRFRFLHFGQQGMGLYVWALVDTDSPIVEREINVTGTGWTIDNSNDVAYHIGTVQTSEGLVWHAFLVANTDDAFYDDILARHEHVS